MQILQTENPRKMTDEEIKATISSSWTSCQGWRRCKDGSFEMALSNYGFYEACREAERRGIEWRELAE